MAPSVLPAVIDALVRVFDAALSVPVFDGPPLTDLSDPAFVLVGATETTEAAETEDAATTSQQVSDLGNLWREESGEVTCSAWAWSGDTPLSALRASASAIVASCTDALAADPTLGGVLGPDRLAEVTTTALRQVQTPDGPVVRVTFTVAFSALLTE